MNKLRQHIRSILLEDMKQVSSFKSENLAIWHTQHSNARHYIVLYDWPEFENYVKFASSRIKKYQPSITPDNLESELINEFPGIIASISVGAIILHTPIYPCNNAEEIKVVAAWPGYGPAIYDLAMSISKNGIFADRRSVSPKARKVWDYYFEKRPEIEKKMLDDFKAKYTPEDNDDCQPSARKKKYGMYGHRPGPESEHKKDSMNYSYNTDYAVSNFLELVNIHEENSKTKYPYFPWENRVLQNKIIWEFYEYVKDKVR
tara:strand:+ start:263 stop:1042 length:780 start_codon:yes stop_codon:yes gene_type:complete